MDDGKPLATNHATAAETTVGGGGGGGGDGSTLAGSSPSAAARQSQTTTTIKAKCQKCDKRVAKEGCTQSACIQCCNDADGCESHKKQRAMALWKEQVLAGTTKVQQLAAERRKLRLQTSSGSGVSGGGVGGGATGGSRRRCFFREPGFVYQGDTVVIWDVRAFASNAKWRDDAIRKSMRRKRAELPHSTVTAATATASVSVGSRNSSTNSSCGNVEQSQHETGNRRRLTKRQRRFSRVRMELYQELSQNVDSTST